MGSELLSPDAVVIEAVAQSEGHRRPQLPANARIGEIPLHFSAWPVGLLQELLEWTWIIQLRKSVKECGAGHHNESRSETSGRSKEVDGLFGSFISTS
jgi:hypothetical protein